MTRTENHEGFITIKEAADMLGVVPMTVYRMFDRGQLNKHKDRRNNYSVWIKQEEVEALLVGPQIESR
ncbi:helix-turn-helix domain-containing protein [Geodermatophilus sp. DSM 45219]|uniref:helix-turn-helix domain-containing protein n=1 Tax=Geodermatophilus sp. DSM 45219 TaxID=1881103 RepID=UPI00088B0D31|nr:helix-turn-helix domain-containing protein [Geodermatophilus sp. DSM 45219]SDN79689.1 DNA binding domain-containing protein, excisionase family [Geodermatophilus sp. DSM 45219]